MEIVSEPDIRSIEEGIEYLEKLQMIMRYIGVSDCKMQEGSMRCDVNISVRPAGSEEFGIRSEIKNMNSFAHIAKAMEYEYNRKVDAAENGEILPQETRRYNETTGETEGMRTKEDAHDSVSYTHLDVYKRQRLHSYLCHSRIIEVSFATDKVLEFLL